MSGLPGIMDTETFKLMDEMPFRADLPLNGLCDSSVGQKCPTLTTHTYAHTSAMQEALATAFSRTHGTQECSAWVCL